MKPSKTIKQKIIIFDREKYIISKKEINVAGNNRAIKVSIKRK